MFSGEVVMVTGIPFLLVITGLVSAIRVALALAGRTQGAIDASSDPLVTLRGEYLY